jgi:hypothetical protein
MLSSGEMHFHATDAMMLVQRTLEEIEADLTSK